MAELDPVVPETPPVVTPPVVTPPAEPDEPGSVVVGDQKMVPLSALISERDKGKDLKTRADQFDQLSGYVSQVKPYIEFLQANPDLMTRATAPAPTPAAVPEHDPVAEQLAKTLDLYTPDGKPDIARAKTLVTVIDTIADAKADARVKPIAESTAKSKSAENFQRALVTVTPDGRKVDPAVLKGIWERLPVAATADETQAGVLVYAALGYDVMHGTKTATPSALPTPLVSESNTGRITQPAALSSFDESVAASRGITPQNYATLTAGYVKGRPSTLED